MDPEPGERVFFHGHPSWRSILSFYVKGLLATVFAGALTGLISAAVAGKVQVGWVVVVMLLAFALILLAVLIKRVQTTYTITDRRLTIDTGILARQTHETRLERVQNVNCTQSLLERLLSVGSVDFDTAGGAEYDFCFHGVEDPRRIVRTVDQALQERLPGS